MVEKVGGKDKQMDNEWISMSECPPEKGAMVTEFTKSTGKFLILATVTHWMVLPDAPKGGE